MDFLQQLAGEGRGSSLGFLQQGGSLAFLQQLTGGNRGSLLGFSQLWGSLEFLQQIVGGGHASLYGLPTVLVTITGGGGGFLQHFTFAGGGDS